MATDADKDGDKPGHLFICHSTTCRQLAEEFCSALEAQGQRCWIAPRDVPAGSVYAAAIHSALSRSTGVILLWNDAAADSEHVQAELEMGMSLKKKIFPVKLTQSAPNAELRYYVGRRQWIVAEGRTTASIVLDILATQSGGSTRHEDGADVSAGKIQPGISRRRSIQRIGAGAAAAMVGLAGAAKWSMTPRIPRRHEHALIVCITPKDGFGPLRRAGAHALVNNVPSLRIADLAEVSIEDMKRGQLGTLSAELASLLQKENVLAVVGPSITEATDEVLSTVDAVASGVPVIIECSGAATMAGWKEGVTTSPVFRLNSGIEQRAVATAQFLADVLAAGLTATVLVEEQLLGEPMSYGEYLFRETVSRTAGWSEAVASGKVQTYRYDIRRKDELFSFLDARIERSGVILALGMGYHVRAIADQFYRNGPETPRDVAPLIGWMVAHSLADALETLRTDRLFELTDMDIEHETAASLKGLFTSAFGPIGPHLRDTAFSFDAVHVLSEAYSRTNKALNVKPDGAPEIDRRYFESFADTLRKTSCQGITGTIAFEGTFAENKGCVLRGMRYNRELSAWEQMDSNKDMIARMLQRG